MPEVPKPTLHLGSTGPAVRELQAKLRGIAVDGQFGRQTQLAVIAFQTSHQLVADGVVGRRTWYELGRS